MNTPQQEERPGKQKYNLPSECFLTGTTFKKGENKVKRSMENFLKRCLLPRNTWVKPAAGNPGQNSPFRGRLDRMSSWR